MDNVDLLANAMCRLGYEKRKQDIAQGHLGKIFTDYFFGEPKEFSYAVENGSKATTDGYLLASHNGPLFIVEYKRQIAAAEPQLASYFLRLALKPAEDIFRQWRQPALGLLIRGELRWFSWRMSLTQALCQGRTYPSTAWSWSTNKSGFFP
jgi:hypothetical protein